MTSKKLLLVVGCMFCCNISFSNAIEEEDTSLPFNSETEVSQNPESQDANQNVAPDANTPLNTAESGTTDQANTVDSHQNIAPDANTPLNTAESGTTDQANTVDSHQNIAPDANTPLNTAESSTTDQANTVDSHQNIAPDANTPLDTAESGTTDQANTVDSHQNIAPDANTPLDTAESITTDEVNTAGSHQNSTPDVEDPDKADLMTSEIRLAAFLPMGNRCREIYGVAGLSLQAEMARMFKNHQNIGIWGNVEWIFMNGDVGRSCGDTTLDILNISVGFKAIGHFYKDRLVLHIGIGPDVGIVFLENNRNSSANCSNKNSTAHECKTGLGGILKTGGQIYFTDDFYTSVFIDYLYLPINFTDSVEMGGLKLGGGIGLKF